MALLCLASGPSARSPAYWMGGADATDGVTALVVQEAVVVNDVSINKISSKSLDLIKRELHRELNLTNPQKLEKHTGLSTGCPQLDSYLSWNGLPKGELCLFRSDLGLGATSLWLDTASFLLDQGRWVAWVGGKQDLFPLALTQRRLNLHRIFIVEPPTGRKTDERRLFWSLQELLSADMFDLIGCDLSESSLKPHQVRKLARQAKLSRSSLVFFRSRPCYWAELCSLVLEFHSRGITAIRARHRPTPFTVPRRWSYAHLMSEYKGNLQRGFGRYLSKIQSPCSVPQA